ncbi:Hpt protein [Thalassoporum mexicanum PCC 7367]|uniref:Hpt domain-containing protein n=1 Tax=Thalassoporum mexicanum TaxID=3457544 RepID=UPI00029F8C81|nr:Hpt domain-containing protein [Pseudanabaena sp. PCC 7367]AFY69942.1 Hpt protein [Pseudanabaena sp. PCC 7367]
MDPEKQKQIMGYFIEEARDHLNTIEQGLLNIQDMMSDPEAINEVFRAAHSIKGGAAMLGIGSVQRTAHNLEDYFKVLRDTKNMNVDQDLQTLFLSAFDKLQDLLDQLQGPYGLSQEVGDSILADAEPIFKKLRARLEAREVEQPVAAATATMPKQTMATAPMGKSSDEARAMAMFFQTDVPMKLRDMLQLFKQPDRPTSRQNLQAICDQLYKAGEQFELKQWRETVQAVKGAVSNQNNSYRALAPIVIKEVKQAQELVLAQKADQIKASEQLRQLLPPETVAASTSADDDISSIFGAVVEEDKATQSWKDFGDRLGWRTRGSWIRTADVAFDRNVAPEGHLPAPVWLAAWDKAKDSNADELRGQVEAFMAKLAECEIG